ncbi:glycoside hydrolase family 85 protein [[Candida] arabinofermentans NRRL YB-2248]|uniref:Glycoside hydrolase family 85 protein n=1 Tax=[Candida] arabinofermentans NRRL YB-2248 TaxID=983967 RepID=A0A1E4SWP1_9ASCO|nr:glycoside hydrolase family 85 protein [[Candida] arabinofermentans NRRL YB-2248]
MTTHIPTPNVYTEYQNKLSSTYFKSLDELQSWYHSVMDHNSNYNFLLDSNKKAKESLSSYHRSTKAETTPTLPNETKDVRTKLMICHDFKGGYQDNEDDNPTGYFPHPTGSRYFLQYPQFIDKFVYFSHHRVSIPPASWINSCHKNGIKCFGTIIFEGQGFNDFEELDKLVEKDNMGQFKLVRMFCYLVDYFGFDGYLLNVETKFSNLKKANDMISFVDSLKSSLHALDNKNELVWYDSYIHPTNRVHYINGVTDLNFNFYRCSDSLFTNYWWTVKNLQENIKNVGLLGVQNNIYVGYDVWGRGTLVGKGGFDSSLACQMIKKYKSNVALFATAWTYEYLGYKNFVENDTRFWIGLFDNESSISSSITPYNSTIFRINDSSFIFYTNFNTGEGKHFFSKGLMIYNNTWVNSNLQSEIPINVHKMDKNGLQLNLNKIDAFNGGSSLEVKYTELIDEDDDYQIFNDQTIKNVNLFNFIQECHFQTVGVKLTYKLNHKTKSIFKLKVKYYIERRYRSISKVRTGYLTIPLTPTHDKWFTIVENFQIQLQNSREYIILESVELNYENTDDLSESLFKCHIMEDSIVTSVIDNEEYEKLINNGLYMGGEFQADDEDWVLIPDGKEIGIGSDENGKRHYSDSTASSKSGWGDRWASGGGGVPILKIGEFAIINANDYPSSGFFQMSIVKSDCVKLIAIAEDENGFIIDWSGNGKTGNLIELLYYLVFINDEFIGTSLTESLIFNSAEFNNTKEVSSHDKSKNKLNDVEKVKIRIDSVDRLGRVVKGEDSVIQLS